MKIGGLPWFASHAWTPCLDHRFVLKKLLKKLWCRSISDKEAPDLFTEACNCTSKKESKEPQGVASSSEEKKTQATVHGGMLPFTRQYGISPIPRLDSKIPRMFDNAAISQYLSWLND